MPQLVIKALHVCYFFDPFSGSKLVQRYDALSQNKYDCSSKIISKIAKMLKLLFGQVWCVQQHESKGNSFLIVAGAELDYSNLKKTTAYLKVHLSQH